MLFYCIFYNTASDSCRLRKLVK